VSLPSPLILLFAFGALLLLFGIVESRWPGTPGQPRWRKDSATDLAYWFFTPLVIPVLIRGGALIVLLLVAWVSGVSLQREHIKDIVANQRDSTWPPLAQIPAMILVGDFISYWTHRFLHGRRLWPFHAVHHSSLQVDWLSSVRVHPVNELVGKSTQAAGLLLLGFDTTLLAAYTPLLTLYAIFVHANVPWTYGPLRYVLVSPAFHRWHHTSQAEGLDRNFAGLLPLWDILFNTFYMPRGRRPEVFGITGGTVPEGLFAQLQYPFQQLAEPVLRPATRGSSLRARDHQLEAGQHGGDAGDLHVH